MGREVGGDMLQMSLEPVPVMSKPEPSVHGVPTPPPCHDSPYSTHF